MAADAEAKAAAVLDKLKHVGAKVFYEKQLTSSDVSASGRVVVPKVCPSIERVRRGVPRGLRAPQ